MIIQKFENQSDSRLNCIQYATIILVCYRYKSLYSYTVLMPLIMHSCIVAYVLYFRNNARALSLAYFNLFPVLFILFIILVSKISEKINI